MKIEHLTGQAGDLRRKIESLLPGAASTGLAKSFLDRKNDLKRPRLVWGILSLCSIASLVLVGLFGEGGLLDLSRQETIEWMSVLRGTTIRLPVAAPLIWIAIYTGRHHLLSARLEEDYAYKEAVSRAFEGYKREMENIVQKDPNSSALSVLCANVLHALAESPGRLYDKKHQDFTPLNVLLESLDNKTVIELAKKLTLGEDQVRDVILSFVSLARRK